MSIREFRKSVCCGHGWATLTAEGMKAGNVKLLDGVSADICCHCGAKCERDKKGRIVDFDALWNFGTPIHIDDVGSMVADAERSSAKRKNQRRNARA